MLFDTMGLPHGKKTQRGWSTDAETLESLRDYPLVDSPQQRGQRRRQREQP